MEFILFSIVGALSGFAAGLLGIGGGLITVPAMVLMLPYFGFESSTIMHVAIATSLAAIVPTSMMSAYKHHTHKAINWSFAKTLVPGLIVGSFFGVFLTNYITRDPLQVFFASFVLLLSLYMLIGQPLPRVDNEKRSILEKITGVGIGAISAVLGVGGGTMTVPFLVWRGVSPHVAVGTSAFCGIPIAVTAVVTFLISSDVGIHSETGAFIYWEGLMFIIFGSLLFAPLGANFAHSLSTLKLKRIFALLLLIISIELFLDVFGSP